MKLARQTVIELHYAESGRTQHFLRRIVISHAFTWRVSQCLLLVRSFELNLARNDLCLARI